MTAEHTHCNANESSGRNFRYGTKQSHDLWWDCEQCGEPHRKLFDPTQPIVLAVFNPATLGHTKVEIAPARDTHLGVR